MTTLNPDFIRYTLRYSFNNWEYTHVIIPKYLVHKLPGRPMTISEWRELGIQMTMSWENYKLYPEEDNVILFRRKLET